MGTTSLGIYYPDPSGVPKRQDLQDMATTTDAAILAAAPQSAWPSYTSIWSASTTAPVLGNGSIVARFLQVGKHVDFRILLTMGSGTTYGSGQYNLSLPVQAHSGNGLQFATGEATIGGGAWRLSGRIASGGTTVLLYCDPTTAGSSLRAVTPTTPGTFAAGHTITMTGTYEAA